MATKAELIKQIRDKFGDVVTRSNIVEYCNQNNIEPPHWLFNVDNWRVARGQYRLPEFDTDDRPLPLPVEFTTKPSAAESTSIDLKFQNGGTLVPAGMSYYVPFGNHADIDSIISSGMFLPTFITGLSGNGKTSTVKQVCFERGREFIRVNITSETSEDDLLGGFRLVNGETVFHKGPVILAMERGAILLLDEIDLGSNKIMCLQPILEGNGVFLKKINEFVNPKPGFNIIATANTKGQGNEHGKFVGTNVLNEAFLDRFGVTMEQDYPPEATEAKILLKVMGEIGCVDKDYASKLVQWAGAVREAYKQNSLTEVITTRRLVDCIRCYRIFADRVKAITMVTARFDSETRKSIVDFYQKIDDKANFTNYIKEEELAAKPQGVEVPDGEIPF